MSKAQTDIRSTSYDAATANPYGYQGTIADALAHIRVEIRVPVDYRTRDELLRYLGVDRFAESAGPSVEMDENPRYGDDEASIQARVDGLVDQAFIDYLNYDPRN
jgi:hypothetical protein